MAKTINPKSRKGRAKLTPTSSVGKASRVSKRAPSPANSGKKRTKKEA